MRLSAEMFPSMWKLAYLPLVIALSLQISVVREDFEDDVKFFPLLPFKHQKTPNQKVLKLISKTASCRKLKLLHEDREGLVPSALATSVPLSKKADLVVSQSYFIEILRFPVTRVTINPQELFL